MREPYRHYGRRPGSRIISGRLVAQLAKVIGKYHGSLESLICDALTPLKLPVPVQVFEHHLLREPVPDEYDRPMIQRDRQNWREAERVIAKLTSRGNAR